MNGAMVVLKSGLHGVYTVLPGSYLAAPSSVPFLNHFSSLVSREPELSEGVRQVTPGICCQFVTGELM